MTDALNRWAEQADVTPVPNFRERVDLLGLGQTEIWYQGADQAWLAWNSVAHLAEWTEAENAEAWAFASSGGNGTATITWDRPGGPPGTLRLIELWSALMALAAVGRHSKRVFAALQPSLLRGLVESGLADVLTAYAAEVGADGQPAPVGEERTLRDLLGPAPSAEVAQHALGQGVDALPLTDSGRLVAVDLTGLLDDGRED